MNELKNMCNLEYLRKHKPLLKLIYNLVRKFTYVHPKYYSLTKYRYASVDPNNFTAIIPCEFDLDNQSRRIQKNVHLPYIHQTLCLYTSVHD